MKYIISSRHVTLVTLRSVTADPGVEGVVTLHDLAGGAAAVAIAAAAAVHLDGEHAADRPVVGEPRLSAQVLKLLDAVSLPQYPVAPTLPWEVVRKKNARRPESMAVSYQRPATGVPCGRPPLLLGLGRLAGVRVGVVRVLVRRREADLSFVPASEHSPRFSLDQQLHAIN